MFAMMAPAVVSEVNERPSISSKSSSISGTPNIKQGGNKFMSKFFSNKPSTPKETTNDETSVDELRQLGEFPPGLIMPCPFIRPLEHKLQARSEPMNSASKPKTKPRSIDTLSTSGSSASQIAVNGDKTHRILNNTFAGEGVKGKMLDLSTMGSAADGSIMESITDLSAAENQEDAEDDMEVQISRQLEYVAVIAAEGSQVVHHWAYYIQCYSKVRQPLPNNKAQSMTLYRPRCFSCSLTYNQN
jgi:hypothetical protein